MTGAPVAMGTRASQSLDEATAWHDTHAVTECARLPRSPTERACRGLKTRRMRVVLSAHPRVPAAEAVAAPRRAAGNWRAHSSGAKARDPDRRARFSRRNTRTGDTTIRRKTWCLRFERTTTPWRTFIAGGQSRSYTGLPAFQPTVPFSSPFCESRSIRRKQRHPAFMGPCKRWRDPDSNRGHHDFQSCALPTELSRQRAGRLARA
jgi:hypothetical protein